MLDSPYEHGSGAEVPKRDCPHGMRLCTVREKGGGNHRAQGGAVGNEGCFGL